MRRAAERGLRQEGRSRAGAAGDGALADAEGEATAAPAAGEEAPQQAEGPIRRDLASRSSDEARAMLRFVVDPQRRLVPDLAHRMPGRGLWLKADRSSVETAIKRRVFEREAKGPVSVPDDLPALLERLLVQRCMEALGLARRAGELVMGFDQVEAVLEKGEVGVLVEAADAARHGRGKLRAKAGKAPVVACLTREEMGRALGRDAVVHAWIRNGRLATRLTDDATRLCGFRPESGGESGAGRSGTGVDEQQGT